MAGVERRRSTTRGARLVAERTKVIENVRNEYNAKPVRGAQLRRRSSRKQKAAATDLDKKGGDYNILKRKADSERDGLQQAADAAERTHRHRQQPRQQRPGDGAAEVPRRADLCPTRASDWITALLAGVIVAFGLAFGIEYLDDTVKTPEDITRRLSCRCSASCPRCAAIACRC